MSIFSGFSKLFGRGKTAIPRDPQAPIKSLMANAPKVGGQMGENARMKRELLGSFKKGGTVKKTGIYKLHKGEEVVPAKKKEMAGKMKSNEGYEKHTTGHFYQPTKYGKCKHCDYTG
jgi:hypothetical protein